jgi:anti-anti-sigma factor
MRVKTRRIGSIWIVDVVGELKGGNEVKVTAACRELLAAGGRLVVINLLRVPWIGSEGLGEVMACRQEVDDLGGQLKVVLCGKTHDLFVVCCLQSVLDLYENVEEALAGFAVESPTPAIVDLDRISIG